MEGDRGGGGDYGERQIKCAVTDQEAEEVRPVRELGSESEGSWGWEGGGQAEQFH